uniref:Uncharacterized protein n=1 Tax=Erpetoichthys calabaricus TaxID=27687 RepID=A0A8C4T2B3_ERPCA
MAGINLLVTKDEFICSICLETLRDPVSIPCGHNFCMKCITECWDQMGVCRCPQCRETYAPRLVLRRNTLLAEVVERLTNSDVDLNVSQNVAGPGDVQCDVCSEKKCTAVKSCLTCLASYCESHIQPHYMNAYLSSDMIQKYEKQILLLFCFKLCFFLMQNFSSQCVPPGEGDSLSITMTKDFSFENMRKKLYNLKGYLDKVSQWEVEQITPAGTSSAYVVMRFLNICLSLHSDTCQLTLDLDTAHPKICLSDGNRKMTLMKDPLAYPDHPSRFNCYQQVLCKESLRGPRCYCEVQWNGCAVLGVANERISRKGWGADCRLGGNNKSWSLCCSASGFYARYNNMETKVSVPCDSRIGVFLDRTSSSLSFYSIGDKITLLYKFQSSFDEPLYMGFGLFHSPGFSVTICNLSPST